MQIVLIIEQWKSNKEWVLEYAQEENNELSFKWNRNAMACITSLLYLIFEYSHLKKMSFREKKLGQRDRPSEEILGLRPCVE